VHALLAGSDGGAAYADWPRIGGEWIPTSAFALEPVWRNFTEDHATQHLLHRLLENDDAFSFWGMVIRQFRLLLLAREVLDSHGGKEEVARDIRAALESRGGQ